MLSLFCKKPLLYLGALSASLALLSPATARDLYWNTEGEIVASDIDGGNVEVLFDGSSSSPQMESIIVDVLSTDDHIYWTGHSGGDIWRANRDGSDATQFIPDAGASIHFLEIDEARQKIYYSDFSAGLFEANLDDGSGITSFWWDTTPGAFAGLAMRGSGVLWISAGSNYLYETDPTFPNSADFTQLEGGEATYGLAYNPDTETAYYTNFEENTLRSYNFATEEHELLHTPGMTSPLDVTLSPSGTHLLIAERGRGITGYEISTGGYELLVDNSDVYFGVTATADPGTLEVPPPPPPPAEDGDVIFAADFEDDTLGEVPALESEGGVWTNWQPRDTPDSVFVEQDGDDLFGYGAENQFMRVENSIGSYIDAVFSDPTEVATLSLDVILRRTTVSSDGSERNGFGFFGDSGRLHIFSLSSNGGIRGGSGGAVPMLQRARVDIVLNNSADEITYDAPDGGQETLASERVAVWLDGELIDTHDAFGRRGTTGNISYVRLPHFSSTDRYSMDLDNVTVFMGAHVFQPIVEGVEPDPDPDPTFLGYLAADFEGIPTGEITRDNVGDFLHGNLSAIGFHSRYDINDPETDDPDFEPSPLLVATDTDDRFGKGTDNQVLRTNGARGWTLSATNNFNQEVMTLRIDMIVEQIGGGRLTSRFFDADGEVVSRFEIRTPTDGVTFDPNSGTFEYGTLVRLESVVNNSADEITYNDPTGGTTTLVAGGTDMWINGELVFGDSLEQRTATSFGPIMRYSLNTFSTNPWDADIDLVQTHSGVELVGAESGGETYASWQETHFPGETDPSIIGPDANPSGDGVPNLLKYALGLDPNEASRDGVPASGVQEFTVDDQTDEYLTLTFTKPDSVEDVGFSVKGSSDLVSWPDEAVLEESQSNGDGTTTFTYRDSTPLGSADRRFINLEVTILD